MDGNKAEKTSEKSSGRGFWGWLAAVLGWLACAGMCLATSVALEEWPYAYEMLFYAILLMLFGNIMVFLFISSRWANQPGRLASSVIRVCAGEGFILAGLYALGRFCIGA